MTPWYQAEPFKTLLGVVVGGLLTLIGSFVANWWLKRLEIKAKSEALKMAFQAEVSALRAALRADVVQGHELLASNGVLRPDVKYARVIFERNAGQIGDLRDPILVGQLAAFYTLLDRVEEFGRAAMTTVTPDYSRLMASLGSALHMATIVDMKLTTETARFRRADFTLTVTEQDAKDQRLAKTTIERYGDGPTR